MKKILLWVLPMLLLNYATRADVVVYNDTDYPIKFGMAWIGKTLYNCSNLFDANCWADSTTWPEVIGAHRRVGKGGELNNIKTRYTILADMTGKGDFKEVISKTGLSDTENREVFVTYNKDTKTWNVASEGWHGDRNMRQSTMQGVHKGDYFNDQPVVRGFGFTPHAGK